jgi:preprotein translocase subunit YajC
MGDYMFGTPAFAQTTGAATSGGGLLDAFSGGGIAQFLPLIVIGIMFYMLMIRPQQKAMKDHREMVAALKRGDIVVLNSGVIGKVTRVDDTEISVEIATGVVVKVERAKIERVRSRGEPAPANDAKTS